MNRHLAMLAKHKKPFLVGAGVLGAGIVAYEILKKKTPTTMPALPYVALGALGSGTSGTPNAASTGAVHAAAAPAGMKYQDTATQSLLVPTTTVYGDANATDPLTVAAQMLNTYLGLHGNDKTPALSALVRAFQGQYNVAMSGKLAVDGLWGPMTMAALGASTINAYSKVT